MKRSLWAVSVFFAALMSASSIADQSWNAPNHGYLIQVSTPNGIPQKSGSQASIAGLIKFTKGTIGPKPEFDELSDLLSREGIQIKAFWPDLTNEVTSGLGIARSGKDISFNYKTPNLSRSDLNTFTLQVIHVSEDIAALERIQAKLDRRVLALNQALASLKDAHASQEDQSELKSLQDHLQKISSRIQARLSSRSEILAEVRFPLQVDNIVAGPSYNATVMGKRRFAISYDWGSTIDGEVTTAHGVITNIRNSSDSYDDARSEDQFVAQFFWNGNLVKSLPPQGLPGGASVAFDYTTPKLSSAVPNSFSESLYAYEQDDGIGKKFGENSFDLPTAPDSTAPVWTITSPDPKQFCVRNAQPVVTTLADSFGLVDPSSFQFTLTGTLVSGGSYSADVTHVLSSQITDIGIDHNSMGQAYAITGDLNSPQLAEGVYTLTLVGADLAGNAGQPNPIQSTWRIDRTAPQILLSGMQFTGPGQLTNIKDQSLSIVVSDLCQFLTTTVTNNGTTVGQGTGAVINQNIALSEGPNFIEVTSQDQAGNSSSSSTTVTLDTIPPVLSNLFPANNGIVQSLAFTLTGSANEPLSYAKVNGQTGTLSADSKSFSSTVTAQSEGPLDIHLEAADLAGNITTQDLSVQVLLKVLNGDLLAVVPSTDGLHLTIHGAPGATRPGLTVNASAGFFNNGSAIGSEVGSFDIVMNAFSQATVTATDPTIGRTDTATVSFGMGSGTLLSGTVLDTSGQPLAGATVSIAGTNLSTHTDGSGVYKFSKPVTGDQRIVIDGTTIPAAVPPAPQRSFSRTSVSVSIGLSESNVLPNIYLEPIPDSATAIDPAAGGQVTDGAGVVLTIPQNTAVYPIGVPQKISIATISSQYSTITPPEFAFPKHVVTLEPSGMTFTQRVPLTLPNSNHLPAGTRLVIFSMNSQSGFWEIDGTATVSSDATSVKTDDGLGISHFSSVYAAPLGPQLSQAGAQDKPGADTFNGAVSTSVQMPGFKVLGKSVSPTLAYKSSWAKPSVLMTDLFDFTPYDFNVDLDPQTANILGMGRTVNTNVSGYFHPISISSKFSTRGLLGTPAVFTGTDIPEKGVVSYSFDLFDPDNPGQYLPTGVYPYTNHYEMQLEEITITTTRTHKFGWFGAHHDDTKTDLARKTIDQLYPVDLSGLIYTENESKSPIGRGWKQVEAQKIVNPADDRIFIEEPDGTVTTYAINNSISTLWDGTSSSIDFTQGMDITNFPSIAAIGGTSGLFGQSNSIYSGTINSVNSASLVPVASPSAMSGVVNGTHFMIYPSYQDAFPKWGQAIESSYSANYTVSSVIKQLLLLPDGRIFGADYNRSQLIQAVNGTESKVVGAITSPPPTFNTGFGNIPPGVPTGQDGQIESFCSSQTGVSCQPIQYLYNHICAPRYSNSEVCLTYTGIPWNYSFTVGQQYCTYGGAIYDDFFSSGCYVGDSQGSYPVTSPSNDGNLNDTVNAPTLNQPMGIAAGPRPNTIVIADTGHNRVRLVDLNANTITTVAGNEMKEDFGDGGPATSAGIFHPRGVVYDTIGNLYISTEGGMIRKVDPFGTISTIVGAPGATPGDNMAGTKVLLNNPFGMVFDNDNGYLYVADTGNNVVRRYDTSTGVIKAVAGNFTSGYSPDNTAALNASISSPTLLALDGNHNVLFVDSGNKMIRKINFQNFSTGVVTFAPSALDNSKLTLDATNSDPNQRWTRAYRNGNVAHFNAQGLQTDAVDRVGRATAFGYDANSNLTSVKYADGRSTHYNFSGNVLTSIQDPTGRSMTFGYDGPDLAWVQFPDGSKRSFNYDTTNGLMKSDTDALSNTTSYTYNTWGRINLITTPDGNTITINDSGSATAANNYTADNVGHMQTYGPDPGQANDSVQSSTGKVIKVIKDTNGYISTIVDALGRQTTMTRDFYGRITQVTRPNGSTLTYNYDPTTGDLISQSDSYTKVTTSQSFDAYGNLLEQTDGRLNSTQYKYNSVGQLIQKTDPLLNSTYYTYNGPFGLMDTVTSPPHNSVTRYTYDSLGNETSVTLPGGISKLFTLDTYGRGNIVKVTDNNNHSTNYEFDSMNHLTAAVTPKGERTEYSYLPTGQMYQIKDALGNISAVKYDEMGRVKSETDPLGNTTAYSYDPVTGKTSEVIDPNGNKKILTYDDQGRLKTKQLPDDYVSFTYNPDGSINTVTNNYAQIGYGYDDIGRLTSSSEIGVGGLSYPGASLAFTYDENGNRNSVTEAGIGKTVYGYDADDRLESIQDPRLGTFNLTKDDQAGTAKFSRPGTNGTIDTTVSTDPTTGLLNSILHTVGGTIVSSYGFSFDAAGNVTKISTTYGDHLFGYDPNTQLTSATNPEIAPGTAGTYSSETFSYDSISNRSQDQQGTFAYDQTTNHSGQRLVSDYKYFYFYDKNGNLTSRQARGLTGEVTNYFYSSENQLVGFKIYLPGAYDPTTLWTPTSVPVREVSFVYDPMGRRIQKKVADYQNSKSFTRQYAYYGGGILYEMDGSGNRLARYTRAGQSSDDVFAAEIYSAGVSAGLAQNEGVYYYLKDAMGSVVDVVDTSGKEIQHYVYSAYGDILDIRVGGSSVYSRDSLNTDDVSKAPLATSFTFIGRERDFESGFYYLRARYYNPSIGRFLQQDPAVGHPSIPMTMVNKYAYSGNNPATISDSSGMDWDFFTDILPAIIGVAAAVVGIFCPPAEGVAVALLGTLAAGVVAGNAAVYEDGKDPVQAFANGMAIAGIAEAITNIAYQIGKAVAQNIASSANAGTAEPAEHAGQAGASDSITTSSAAAKDVVPNAKGSTAEEYIGYFEQKSKDSVLSAWDLANEARKLDPLNPALGASPSRS